MPSGEKVYFSFCSEHCTNYPCAMKVFVRDGRIARIEGNPAHKDPVMCAMGWTRIQGTYHPGRLKYPLKRVGERGEGKWQRVSWDEALTAIAGKLTEIKAKYGNEALCFIKYANGHFFPDGADGNMMMRLLNHWGGAIEARSRGHLCGLASGTVYANNILFGVSPIVPGMPPPARQGQCGHPPQDWANSKLAILWARNVAETYPTNEMKWFLQAKEAGTRIIYIDPRYTRTAAVLADEWIPIKPGTDLALMLSMIQVIISEGLYHRDFVLNHTVAPFLVRKDSCCFLRESDIVPGGSSDTYVAWDTGKGKPAFIPPGTYSTPGASPALFGKYNINGIECATAFHLLRGLCAPYAPGKAEKITGINEERIARLAREFASVKPSTIHLSSVMARQQNSENTLIAGGTLVAITGNLGIPGGGFRYGSPSAVSARLSSSPDFPPNPIRDGSIKFPANHLAEAILNPRRYDTKIKALICQWANPVDRHGDSNKTIRAIKSKELELVVVIDMFMTGTAKYADYVLPASSAPFERTSIISDKSYIIFRQPCQEALGESKSDIDIISLLAEKLGMGGHFRRSAGEWIDFALEVSRRDGASWLEGITVERLKKEGVIKAPVPDNVWYAPLSLPFAGGKFFTPSGRVEFYSERAVRLPWLKGYEGPYPFDPLPVYRDHYPEKEGAGNYPLVLITPKTGFTSQSTFGNMPWMHQVNPYHGEYLEINPADAFARGIKEGDEVEVYNERGKIKVRALVTQAIMSGVVSRPSGFWEENANQLTTDNVGYYGECAIYHDARVEVKKA